MIKSTPGDVLERADVAALAPDDPPLHVVGGQRDQRHGRLRRVAGGQALHARGRGCCASGARPRGAPPPRPGARRAPSRGGPAPRPPAAGAVAPARDRSRPGARARPRGAAEVCSSSPASCSTSRSPLCRAPARGPTTSASRGSSDSSRCRIRSSRRTISVERSTASVAAASAASPVPRAGRRRPSRPRRRCVWPRPTRQRVACGTRSARRGPAVCVLILPRTAQAAAAARQAVATAAITSSMALSQSSPWQQRRTLTRLRETERRGAACRPGRPTLPA